MTRLSNLREVLRTYEPERIYVFGSSAHEEEDELSDLDVVIIKRTTAPFFDRLREVARLLPGWAGALDILVYTPEEFAAMQRDGNAFACMITDEGRLIYERPAES